MTAEEDASDKARLRANTVEKLGQLLERHDVQYKETWENPTESLAELFQELSQGRLALITVDHPDGNLCLLAETLRLQVRAGGGDTAPVLLRTHRRAAFGSLLPARGRTECQKNTLRKVIDTVNLWVCGLLGIDLPEAARAFYVAWQRQEEEFNLVAIASKPGLLEGKRATDVEVILARPAGASAPAPSPHSRGRPEICEGRGIAPPGGDEGVAWHWYPACFCEIWREDRPRLDRVMPTYAPFPAWIELVVESINASEPLVNAVLRAQVSGSPVLVLLLRLPECGVHESEQILVCVNTEVSKAQVAEQAKVYKDLTTAAMPPGALAGAAMTEPPSVPGVARLCGAPHYDAVLKAAVWSYALDGACWQAPELSDDRLRRVSAALLGDVARRYAYDASLEEKAAAGGGDFESFDTQPPQPSGPAIDLAAALPTLLAEVVGLGSALGRVMACSERSDRSVIDLYATVAEIQPHLADGDTFSPLGPILRPLLDVLAGEESRPRVAGVTPGAAEAALVKLTASLESLEKDRRYQPSSWRPLCCASHGSLGCEDIVLDALGSAWIMGASTAGGMRPVLWDVGSLAIDILLQTCAARVYVQHFCMICTEQWVEPHLVASWLGICLPAAEETLRVARSSTDSCASTAFASIRQAAVLAEPTLHGETIARLQAHLATEPHEADAVAADALHLVKALIQRVDLGTGTAVLRGSFRGTALSPKAGPQTAAVWRLLDAVLGEAMGAYSAATEGGRRAARLGTLADTSPLLLGLPLLHHALGRAADPLVSPWQKLLLCALLAQLAARVNQDLGALRPEAAHVKPGRSVKFNVEQQKKQEAAAAPPQGGSARVRPAAKTGTAPAQPLLPPPPPPRRVVRFGRGHRLLQWQPAPVEEPRPVVVARGKAAPAPPRFSVPPGGGAGDFRSTTLGGGDADDGALGLWRAEKSGQAVTSYPLLGWPCPLPGISAEQMWHLQAVLGVPQIERLRDTDEQRFIEIVVATAREAAWSDGGGARCLYEILDVVPHPNDRCSTAVENRGPALLLQDDLQIEELKVQHYVIGLVALGEFRVRNCPIEEKRLQDGVVHGAAAAAGQPASHHAQPKLMPLATAYGRFPCSDCDRLMDLSDDSGAVASPFCAHCPECWRGGRAGRRFDLCSRCCTVRPPLCSEDHLMVQLDESPYDRVPVCFECEKEIVLPDWGYPPPRSHAVGAQWDLLEHCPGATPGFFHCGVCQDEHLPPTDLCRGCWTVRCPEGHSMVCTGPHTRDRPDDDDDEGGNADDDDGYKCRHCDDATGEVFMWQCIECPEAVLTVTYPNPEAAKADLDLLVITRRSVYKGTYGLKMGLPVLGTTAGGRASRLGVKAGCSVINVNGTKVHPNSQKIFNALAADQEVQVDFSQEAFEIIYDDAGAIQHDLTIRRRGSSLLVINATPGGPATRVGIEAGFRLVEVNRIPTSSIRWDGIRALDTVIDPAKIYCLKFAKRGPQTVCHIGCGVYCPQGHRMEPQHAGYIPCGNGHYLSRVGVADLLQKGIFDQTCGGCSRLLAPMGADTSTKAWYMCCLECAQEQQQMQQLQDSMCGSTARPSAVDASSSSLRLPSLTSNVEGSGRLSMNAGGSSLMARRRRRAAVVETEPRSSLALSASLMGSRAPSRSPAGSGAFDVDASVAARSQRDTSMCSICAEVVAAERRSPPPYHCQGNVNCATCGTSWLPGGGGTRSCLPTPTPRSTLSRMNSTITEANARRFFHCEACLENGTRFDLCKNCSRKHLRCAPYNHRLEVMEVSPYISVLECKMCGTHLRSSDMVYHCGDCWLRDATCTDRCRSCGKQDVLVYSIDEDARFRVMSSEPTGGEVGFRWPDVLTPEAPVTVFQKTEEPRELVVRLKLRNFIYPAGTRLRLTADGSDIPQEATLSGLLPSGRYKATCTGGCDDFMELEPAIGNHAPVGVWSYSDGQMLTACFGALGWVDMRVVGRDEGGAHVVEPLDPEDKRSRGAWQINLTLGNHAPMWLSAADWLIEHRRWDARTIAGRGACRDPISGRMTDVLDRVWSLREMEAAARDAEADDVEEEDVEADVSASLFAQLLDLVAASRLRRRAGAHRAGAFWVEGAPLSGKTTLLNRLATECVKAHGGEIVPIVLDAYRLTSSWLPDAFATSDGDALDPYLRSEHVEGSRAYWFLKQALYARRALLLIDDAHLTPPWSREPLMATLHMLAVNGHRIVATCEAGAVDKPPRGLTRFRLVAPPTAVRRWRVAVRFADVPAAASAATDRIERLTPAMRATAPMLEFFVGCAQVVCPQKEEEFPRATTTDTIASDDLPVQGRQASSRGSSKRIISKGAMGRASSKLKHARTSTYSNGSRPSALGRMPMHSVNNQKVHTFEHFKTFEMISKPQPLAELPKAPSDFLGVAIRVCCRSVGAALRERPLGEAEPENAEEVKWHMDQVDNCESVVFDLVCALALLLQVNRAPSFTEQEALEAINTRRDLPDTWNVLQPVIDSGGFFIITRATAFNDRGQRVPSYRFPEQCVRQYLAARELHRSWPEGICPVGSVEELVLDDCWHDLLSSFAERQAQQVRLSFTKIDEKQVAAVATFVEMSAAPIVALEFKGSGLGQQLPALRRLALALSRDANGRLQRLDIAANGLASEGAELLCGALAQHPALTYLDMQDNHIGHTGARHAARMLQTNRHITTFNLAKNSIGDEGLKWLLPALVVNATLRSLDLQGNNLGTEHKKQLATILSDTMAERVVNTAHNRRGCPDKFLSPSAQAAAEGGKSPIPPSPRQMARGTPRTMFRGSR